MVAKEYDKRYAEEHRAQSTEHRAQSTEHRAQSTEHRAQSTEHRAQSTEHRAQSTEHRKNLISIIANGQALARLLYFLNEDTVEIRSIFTVLNQENQDILNNSQIIRSHLHDIVFFGMEDIEKCEELYIQYFIVCTESAAFDTKIANVLRNNGIKKQQIVVLSSLGNEYGCVQAFFNSVKYFINNGDQFDFLCTGISYTFYGMDLDEFLPKRGINLAQGSQDLYYGLAMLKYALSFKNAIKQAFVGLSPYSFEYDQDKSFRLSYKATFYYPILKNFHTEYEYGQIVEAILNDKYKGLYDNMPSDLQVNLNDIDGNRRYCTLNHHISVDNLLGAKNEALKTAKKDYPETYRKNCNIFEEYIKLCICHKIKPIIIIFPFHESIRKHYPLRDLQKFYFTLNRFKEKYDLFVLDLWNVNLAFDCFWDLTHLNIKGAKVVSQRIKEQLMKIK